MSSRGKRWARTGSGLIALVAISLLSAAPASIAREQGLKLKSQLTPSLIPGGGADGAHGTANIAIKPDQRRVCFRISLHGLSDVTGGDIHIGNVEGVHGGRSEIDLFDPDDVDGPEIAGCLDVINRPRGLRKIYADHERYYVQIDAHGYDEGALRGRLEPVPLIVCGRCEPPPH